METSAELSVVAMQVARTDRRALSQAWYSALHFHDRRGVPAHAGGPAARRCAAGSCRTANARGATSATVRRVGATLRVAGRGTARARGRHCPNVPSAVRERRVRVSPLAARIVRGVRARMHPNATASFTVRDDAARVHLVMRSEGGRLRVVAVCSPRLKERVERALAHARFVLAGSGARVEVSS